MNNIKLKIKSKLEKIFLKIFQLNKKKYSSKDLFYLNSNDIENWDSLRKLNLVIALEQEFSIKIKDKEVEKFNSFQEIFKIIKKKLK